MSESSARLAVDGAGDAKIDTGVPAVDHLLALLARYGGFDLALEVAPGPEEAEVAAAGRALGEALAAPLRAPGARGHGAGALPADEALAHVSLDVADEPAVFSNADLSEARVGGIDGDLVAAFLRELAEGAGMNLHVRLVEGEDARHVLEAIFKSLGSALGEACLAR